MITTMSRRAKSRQQPRWHKPFLTMLPAIRRQARIAFRNLAPEAREDAVQEVVANCLVAYVRLVELGKQDLAYPSVLARFAVAQYRDGRRVGNRLHVKDVMSGYAQRRKHFQVERLDRFDSTEGGWEEAVVEDHRTPPADQAAFRIDFPAWLACLSTRNRRIAETLALGDRTQDVARHFGLSPGRISQLRGELAVSWSQMHGETVEPERPREAIAGSTG